MEDEELTAAGTFFTRRFFDKDFFDRRRLSDDELLELELELLELLELLLLLELEEEERLPFSDSESLEEDDDEDDEDDEDDIFLLRLLLCFLSTLAGAVGLSCFVTMAAFPDERRSAGGLGDLAHTDTFLVAENRTRSRHSRSVSS